MPTRHSSWLCQKFERETLPPTLPITSRHRKARFVLGVHALSKHRRYRTLGSPRLEDNQPSVSTAAVLLPISFGDGSDIGLLQLLL